MNASPPPSPANGSAPRRPLSLTGLRAFEAVARRLSFSAAADELFLTQPAISRQIKALEDELGAPLFLRGTRKVELTAAGEQLRQAVQPALDRIDRGVRQIRVARGRRHVNLNTFASFASLWLLPRLTGFQAEHPDIDLRISATDTMADLDDPDQHVLLRYDHAAHMPAHAERLFDEVLSPVASPWLLARSRSGELPPLRSPADLAAHTLLEDDFHRPTTSSLSWRRWLDSQGLPGLEPQRWVYVNYTHQQIQGAQAGQGLALARLAMVHDQLTRAELVEPFGPAGRTSAPNAYWLLPMPGARLTPELQAFIAWVRREAELTRRAMGPGPADSTAIDDRRASR